jgi:hypothetical protein
LVSQPSWLQPGDQFDVRVRLTGAPADGALRLMVHERGRSRGDFRRALDGELGPVVRNGAPQPLAQLPAGPDHTVTTSFVLGPGGVNLGSRGVYPVEVQLLAGDGRTLAGFVTFINYLTGPTPEFPPLDVAVAVDLGGPPTLAPNGQATVGPTTLRRVRQRIDLLAATPSVAVTLAPRPETLDGFTAAGSTGEAAMRALRIALAGRPTLGGPYVGLDLAALRQAGLISEAPNQLAAGRLAIQARLRSTAVDGIWLSNATLGREAADEAVRLGFDRALVPPTALDDGDGDGEASVPLVPVRLGTDGPQAMVTDEALLDHLTGGEGVLGAHRFLSELAATWLEAPADRRGVVVRIPADADIDPATVAVALNGLRDGHAVRAVPVDRVFEDVPAGEDGPQVVDLADHTVAHDLEPIAGPLRTARAGVDGLSGLIDDPEQAATLRRSLLISVGTDTPDAERAAYVGGVNAALGTVAGAVVLPDKFRITLTTRSSTIPVTITNNTRRELNVMVQVDSDQLEFPDGRLITTPLPARTTTRLEVPVRVRTSGAFTMDVRVTSPDGTIVLDTSTFDVRSTAISGVGFILSIGAALFLAVWWLRHWRSTRRSRHLMPRGGTAPAATGLGDGHQPDDGGAVAADGDAVAGEPGYRPAHLAGPRVPSGPPPPRQRI